MRCLNLFAQENAHQGPLKVQNHVILYSNGTIKEKGNLLRDSINVYWKDGLWTSYYSDGKIKDSVFYRNKKVEGIAKSFHPNGKVKEIFNYKDGSIESAEFSLTKYNNKGELRKTVVSYKKTRTSLVKFYKNGKVIRQSELNKNRIISVPSNYKNGKHINDREVLDSLQFEKLVLINAGKSTKIKKNALVSLKLKGSDEIYNHLQIEGFSKNKIYCSDFSYDLSPNKKTLKFDSLFSKSFDEIDAIYFSVNEKGINEILAFTTTLTGTLLVIEPILLPLIFLKPHLLINPATPIFVGSGVIIYFLGRKYEKNLVPKEYKLQNYQLRLL